MPISYGRTYFAATVLVLGAMILCELRAAVDAFAGTDAITSNTRSLHNRRRGEYVTVRRLQRRCNHRSMAMHFSSKKGFKPRTYLLQMISIKFILDLDDLF